MGQTGKNGLAKDVVDPSQTSSKEPLRHTDLLTRQAARTAGQARAHTRFVRRMRLALPLAAFAIVAVLFAWPQMDRTMEPVRASAVDGGPVQGRNEVLNPRFESRDEKRQPYTITATRAVQNPANPDEILLETPLADLTLTTGKWIAAESRAGVFEQKKRFLKLQGDVKLYHDDGYEITTDALEIDIESRTVRAPGPVIGHGPAGSLEAKGGLSARTDTGVVILKGPARLVLTQALPGF